MSNEIDPIYEGDSLFVQVTVTEEVTGQGKDITGNTLEALAEKDGVDVAGGTAEVDAVNGVFSASFAQGALTKGVWTLHFRVTDGSERQTVSSKKITVKPSVFAA